VSADILGDELKMVNEALYKFAERSGIDDGLLSQFLRGQREFKLATTERLALMALGLELRRIGGRDGSESQ
jgi:transcriptional regulator with XRE-family HTH domain